MSIELLPSFELKVRSKRIVNYLKWISTKSVSILRENDCLLSELHQKRYSKLVAWIRRGNWCLHATQAIKTCCSPERANENSDRLCGCKAMWLKLIKHTTPLQNELNVFVFDFRVLTKAICTNFREFTSPRDDFQSRQLSFSRAEQTRDEFPTKLNKQIVSRVFSYRSKI